VADETQLNLDGDNGGTPAADVVSFADLKTTVGDAYFTDKGFDADGLKANLTELTTLKTAAAERAAAIPADGKYLFDLPQDFKVPEGYRWTPDEKFTAQISALAKAEGLTQGQLSKLTVAYAQQDLAKKSAAAAAAKADDDAVEAEAKQLLGENYLDRTANVRQAMQGIFGPELARDISFQSAANIVAMEKFINENKSRMATNPGVGGRERGDANTMTADQIHRLAIQESTANR
jgi:hypothetical protein